jgi:hypothetical protein
MALKRAVLVRPKNVGELRPQQADLSGIGWDLAGLAMQAGAAGSEVLLRSFRRSLAGFGGQRLGIRPIFSELTVSGW